MKQLLDFIPLFIFFIVYKIPHYSIDIAGYTVTLGGIYSATFCLMISTAVIYGSQFLQRKKLEKSQLITLVAVTLFGGLTLTFHSDVFIKWKAPVINWIFGCAFFLSQYIGQRPLIQRMLGHVIELPDPLWRRMNISWTIFFLVLGSVNLYVAFTFEKFWVDFKVFGSLILMLIFTMGQFIIIGKHIKPITKK